MSENHIIWRKHFRNIIYFGIKHVICQIYVFEDYLYHYAQISVTTRYNSLNYRFSLLQANISYNGGDEAADM